MEAEEHPNIRDRDWRLGAITVLSKDWRSPFSGILHKAGTPVVKTTFVKFDGTQLAMPFPNASALFLGLSCKMYEKAQSHLDKLGISASPQSEVRSEDEAQFFSALESLMASIVFAHTALESYANEVIPEDYVYKAPREDSRCTELYNKEQVERFLSLDVKLDKILPEVLGTDSPKGSTLWQRYVTLKRLRDRVIHMKETDREGTKHGQRPTFDDVWNELFVRCTENMALIAKDMIAYFAKETPPRWLRKCPF